MKRHVRLAATLAVALMAFSIPSSALAVTLPEDTELDLTSSPAPAGIIVGGQTLLAVIDSPATQSAVRALPVQCALDNDASFVGTRSGGNLSGTFRYEATSACDSPMVELDVYAELLKDGSRKDNSEHENCFDCAAVTTGANDSHNCNSCNGVWRLQSTHTFTYPAAYTLVDYDAGRCTMVSAVQVTCVVKSNKVRV